ncbi:MAG: KilA-N domain-containing protein, partial [Proteobacteria bacterium]|nr:KilA-N domain-containing protein [Pseudomonadota bacterium]
SINELHVIMNAESRNADMIRDGLDKETRFAELQKLATWQLDALHKIDSVKSIKRMSDETYVEESKKESLSA